MLLRSNLGSSQNVNQGMIACSSDDTVRADSIMLGARRFRRIFPIKPCQYSICKLHVFSSSISPYYSFGDKTQLIFTSELESKECQGLRQSNFYGLETSLMHSAKVLKCLFSQLPGQKHRIHSTNVGAPQLSELVLLSVSVSSSPINNPAY